MSEQGFNEIERRLGAMRPADLDPVLKQRVAASIHVAAADDAAELSETDASLGGPSLFRGSVVVGLGVAAMIAFAALVTLLVLQGPSDGDIAEQDPPPNEVDVASSDQPAVPTLLALTRAWHESPDALDAMLAQAAPRNTRPDPEPVPTLADSRRGTYLMEFP